MSVQQVNTTLSNPAERKQLQDMLKEASGAMTRIASEKEFIKESIKKVCDDLDLPKRLVNRLVKVFHKQSFDEEVANHEQFEKIYEIIARNANKE
jgi:cyanate lyase